MLIRKIDGYLIVGCTTVLAGCSGCYHSSVFISPVIFCYGNWAPGISEHTRRTHPAFQSLSSLSNVDAEIHLKATGSCVSCDLSQLQLDGMILIDADLRPANLSGTSLAGANLDGSNLYGANLSESDLGGASLRNVELTGAYLAGANLRSSDLSGTDVTRAFLCNTTYSDGERNSDCKAN